MTRFKYGVLVLIFLLFMTSALLGLLRMTKTSAVTAVVTGGQMPVIIIDPGHGGLDGGAVAADGTVEKGINLEISFILRDLFILNGFEVVMTREEDVSIHDPGTTGIRNQKVSDLRNRLALTSKYPNCVFISVHQNKFGDSRQNGTQVFFGPNNPGSKELAQLVQDNIVGMLQPENKRQCKIGKNNLYLIYEAKCPAILVECGFLSNPAEAEKLTDSEYQSKIAFAVLCSTMDYLGLEYAGTPQQ